MISEKIIVGGDIYIEVAKDAQRPFYVNSKNLNVSVLGTKFNICAYSEDINQSVVLVEGQVKVALEETKRKNIEQLKEKEQEAKLSYEQAETQKQQKKVELEEKEKELLRIKRLCEHLGFGKELIEKILDMKTIGFRGKLYSSE